MPQQALAAIITQGQAKEGMPGLLQLLSKLLVSIRDAPLTDAAALNGKLHALALLLQSQTTHRLLVRSSAPLPLAVARV